MKTFKEIKKIINLHKPEIFEKYNLKEIGVFGSFARNEQQEGSDIDILVDFVRPVGFFKFLELEEYLSILLQAKIDLVSRSALKPIIGRYILKELKKI